MIWSAFIIQWNVSPTAILNQFQICLVVIISIIFSLGEAKMYEMDMLWFCVEVT